MFFAKIGMFFSNLFKKDRTDSGSDTAVKAVVSPISSTRAVLITLLKWSCSCLFRVSARASARRLNSTPRLWSLPRARASTPQPSPSVSPADLNTLASILPDLLFSFEDHRSIPFPRVFMPISLAPRSSTRLLLLETFVAPPVAYFSELLCRCKLVFHSHSLISHSVSFFPSVLLPPPTLLLLSIFLLRHPPPSPPPPISCGGPGFDPRALCARGRCDRGRGCHCCAGRCRHLRAREFATCAWDAVVVFQRIDDVSVPECSGCR